METITLNLIPTGVRPSCHVSQDDNERVVRIYLVDGSVAYSIRSGDVIKMSVQKPNGNVVTAIVPTIVGEAFVDVNVTDDMCNVDGRNICELRIKNGNTRIGTSNFYMLVEANPANSGGGGGSDTFAGLSDVSFTNLQNGQIPKYNSATEMWENATGGGGGGASSLSELDDVSITSVADNQVLKYNSTAQKWENSSSIAPYIDITGTLTAGSTSITLTDSSITTDSTIDVYTDLFGVNPSGVTVSTGSVTLTFEAQASNIGVKVRVT